MVQSAAISMRNVFLRKNNCAGGICTPRERVGKKIRLTRLVSRFRYNLMEDY